MIFLNETESFLNLTSDPLDFQIFYVEGGNDKNFDQNRFYTFKLHRYTNIRDFNESLPRTPKSQDIEIPMIPCPRKNEFDGGWSMSSTFWCPDY